MMGAIASFLAGAGSFFAGVCSQACGFWILDEPKCPKSLIK